jgi:hypothetical protein
VDIDVAFFCNRKPGSPIRCQIVIDKTDNTATMMPAHIHFGFEKKEGIRDGPDGFSVFF